MRHLSGDVRVPAKSTVHAMLDRHGLTAEGTPLSPAIAPNDLWCADPAFARTSFKGEFKLGNGRYCYPLTITDQASRMPLACEALETTKEDGVFEAFQRLFTECGLPNAIRSDNGLPFAPPTGSTIFQSCPCGGSGWASPWNGSGPAIRNRMAAMSACT